MTRRSGVAAAGAMPVLALFGFLLLGDLAWSLKERTVQELAKVQLFVFSQNTLLLNALFGVIPALVVMAAGPTIGAWSDRTRSRYGRRIPFLLVNAPLVFLAMLALAHSNDIGLAAARLLNLPQQAQPTVLLTSMAACWTVFEIFTIFGNAIFMALINDTVPRPILGRFFGLFRIISLAVGALFFYYVYGNAAPEQWQPLLLLIGAVYLLGFLVLCWGVREPSYPPPPAMPESLRLARLRDLAGPGKPWFYLSLFVAIGLGTASAYPVNINSFNARVQFGVSQAAFGEAIAYTYAISIMLAWPLGWLADRCHPLKLGFILLTLYAASMLAALLLVDGRTSFLCWYVVHGVLAGCFLTATASLLPVLLPAERFSQLAALSASITALTTVIATLAMGVVLSYTEHEFHLMFLGGALLAAGGALVWSVPLWQRKRERKTPVFK
ncbi:MFS transporter [Duganella sp. CT11-25]|uniref:MFS transporter n=1 Tax=unclassified Duganella TaxID=2636909 RepID=UPI0039AF072B